jgi:hypothetical protein
MVRGLWLDRDMNKKGRSNNILGWNAPHIHISAEALQAQPVERELTTYEEYLVSIGAANRDWLLLK